MIERIDGLVFARDRVVISDIKLRIFLDHVFGLPHHPSTANALENT